MIEIIEYKNTVVPAFQASGFAARFAFPFAIEVCKGVGYDIGCNRKEWAFPGAIPVDIEMTDNPYHALNLPPVQVDYIFSSHMLEHVPDWVTVLDYWHTKLHRCGVLFLYLPAYSSIYWRPWHNRKHIHTFGPEVIKDYLTDRGWNKIFVSGVDLNNSFMAIAEKS